MPALNPRNKIATRTRLSEVRDVGNGISELIGISLRTLLNPGEEVLVPSPNYPLWSASTILNDGLPVYYKCDRDKCWSRKTC